jgi:hypothetical protein
MAEFRYNCDQPDCTADATTIYIRSGYRDTRPRRRRVIRRTVEVAVRCPAHGLPGVWVTIDTWWWRGGRERVQRYAGSDVVDVIERALDRARIRPERRTGAHP